MPTASVRTNNSANRLMRTNIANFIRSKLRAIFRPGRRERSGQKFRVQEFARPLEWALLHSRRDTPPADKTAGVPGRVCENWLRRGTAAGRPSTHIAAEDPPSRNRAR